MDQVRMILICFDVEFAAFEFCTVDGLSIVV